MKFRRMMAIQIMCIYEESRSPTFKKIIDQWEPEEWAFFETVPKEFKDLPNYIAAQEIKNSPLYKAMKEEEENGTEFDSEKET